MVAIAPTTRHKGEGAAYDSGMDEARVPALAGLSGLGVAVVAVALASATGGPYLTGDAVNGWIVVFAAGLFGAMFATPFVVERRMRPAIADADKRWERSLLLWGAVSVVVLIAGIVVGSAGDFAGDSLAGAIGLIITIEAALVLGTMIVWLLSG